MRRRSRPFHLSVLIPILLTCALAAPAAAQHCWPSSVSLLVRDERGALIHPQELSGYTYTPERPESSDQGHDLEHRTDGRWGPRVPPGTCALHWWGQGDCRVYLDEVVLRRGGREMRLRLNLRLDTEADPGPTEYVIDTPAFQPGTFELGLPLPAGRIGGAAWVTAGRWRRLPDGD
ncbi:MAG TPA: hypothetical protein VEQ60_05375 [Longimicrobium sp.]|nr:hypothetical protein [Longimicrobium sp.]